MRTNPLSAFVTLSLLSARNATVWLSGDQNGLSAPSVPGSGWASIASSERFAIFDELIQHAKQRVCGPVMTDATSPSC